MFFIARVTSLNVDVDAGEETLWGVSVAWQKFFNTGLLGAIITTIVAIAWQLVASAFPLAFLSTLSPTSSSASVSFWGYWYLLWPGFSLGSTRRLLVTSAMRCTLAPPRNVLLDHADDDEQLHMGPGHPRKLPSFTENIPGFAEADEVRCIRQGTSFPCRKWRTSNNAKGFSN
jgi:hypothetical protein